MFFSLGATDRWNVRCQLQEKAGLWCWMVKANDGIDNFSAICISWQNLLIIVIPLDTAGLNFKPRDTASWRTRSTRSLAQILRQTLKLQLHHWPSVVVLNHNENNQRPLVTLVTQVTWHMTWTWHNAHLITCLTSTNCLGSSAFSTHYFHILAENPS